MEYKIKKIRNPQKPEEQEKFYPVPVYSGTKETSELSKEIAHSTSLTKADVAAVIEELIVVFNNHLLAGEKIKINGIGTFKVSFSGNGSEGHGRWLNSADAIREARCRRIPGTG